MNIKRGISRRFNTLKWRHHVRFGPNASIDGPQKATAILLSYKRPFNIQPLARSLLKCAFIEKVIISNQNPQLDLTRWVKITDRRLIMIQQPQRTRSNYRWVMAGQESAPYFIAIDDDLFLYPRQIATLFRHLVRQPRMPHGICGALCPATGIAGDYRENFVEHQETAVDILYQAYAVTLAHVKTYFHLKESIRATSPSVDDYLKTIGDDILISHCGEERPQIHEVGDILRCPTSYTPGIAVFREEGFYRRRQEIFRGLRQTRPF